MNPPLGGGGQGRSKHDKRFRRLQELRYQLPRYNSEVRRGTLQQTFVTFHRELPLVSFTFRNRTNQLFPPDAIKEAEPSGKRADTLQKRTLAALHQRNTVQSSEENPAAFWST